MTPDQTISADVLSAELDRQSSAAVEALARSCEVSLSTVFNAAWAILLASNGLGPDIVFGVTVSGRSAGVPGVQSTLGMFINTLPLRVTLSPAESVRALLARVQRGLVDLHASEQDRRPDILRAAQVGTNALFDTLMVFESDPAEGDFSGPGGIRFGHPEYREHSHFPVDIAVIPGERIRLRLGHDAARCPHAQASALLEHFMQLLRGISTAPEQPVALIDRSTAVRIATSVPGGLDNVQRVLPLTAHQQGLMPSAAGAEQSQSMRHAALFAFAARGRLDRFTQALQHTIDRHDSLRTSLMASGLGVPLQVVQREAPLAVAEVVLDSAADDMLRELYAHPDANATAPLSVVAACDGWTGQWAALLWFEPLVLDAGALQVVLRELSERELSELEELKEARGERASDRASGAPQAHATSRGDSEPQNEAEAFFRDMLADVDEPTLPFGLQSGPARDGIEQASLTLESGLAQRLRELAHELDVTDETLCCLAWARVLGVLSDRDDVVFGVVLPQALRGSGTPGPIDNLLPLRVATAAQGVHTSLQSLYARRVALDAHARASLTLAQRCSALQTPQALCTAVFEYRRGGWYPTPDWPLPLAPGIALAGLVLHANHPLYLRIDDRDYEGFGLLAQVPSGNGAQRICAYLQRALEALADALVRTPQAALHSLRILPDDEWHVVLDGFNSVPRSACDAVSRWWRGCSAS